jgi:cobalamin biosynthetic protein CobC
VDDQRPGARSARLALPTPPGKRRPRPAASEPASACTQLLAPLGEVKATALFATLTTPHANELHEFLARRGILTRRFDQQPLLRFGLPGDETGWQRLAAALNEWKPA